MSKAVLRAENDPYERACEEAIAMCDGNLRSTIKALLMANEFLEAELQEIQAANSSGASAAFAISKVSAA